MAHLWFQKLSDNSCDCYHLSYKLGYCEELVTRLRDNKIWAHKRSRISVSESSNTNLRAKNYYFNTVNATMQNYKISAKKSSVL